MATPNDNTAPAEPAAWWTGEEVAARYRTSKHTVRFWTAQGKIRGAKIGRSVLYPYAEIQRLDRELLEKAGQ